MAHLRVPALSNSTSSALMLSRALATWDASTSYRTTCAKVVTTTVTMTTTTVSVTL